MQTKVHPCNAEKHFNLTDADDGEILDFLKAKFLNICGKDQVINKEEFVKAFGLTDSYFATRFFELFDKNNEGVIDLEEFIDGMKLMITGTPEQKLRFLFNVYDVDGSGEIDHDELKKVMTHCIEESKIDIAEEALSSLTDALFGLADTDNSGTISFDELFVILQQQPEVLNNLTFSAAKWMLPNDNQKTTSKRSKLPIYFTKQYFVNNRKHLIWSTLYTVINISLFLTCIRYRDTNIAVVFARGCGMCLNFNSALLALSMLRYSLTWLRMTSLRYFIPVDYHISYHRFVGYFTVMLSVIHTVAHLVNIDLSMKATDRVYQTNHSNLSHSVKKLEFWEYLLTFKSQVGFVGPGFAYLSGVILMVALLVIFVCALPYIRRNGYFQVFYFTHLLYTVYWLLLILHGPLFWMFFILPGIVFILEKIVPMIQRTATGAKFYIVKVQLLPSKVTHLIISRPRNFQFKAGDYIFITIPAIAKFERHPFTISSAPEHQDEFWLHIRSRGSWTSGVYNYFKNYNEEYKTEVKECNNIENGTENKTSKLGKRMSKDKFTDRNQKEKIKLVNVQVYIDGPYGTATRDVKNCNHVVLISCGIGVTPYAAILQSFMYQHQHSMDVDSDTLCTTQGIATRPKKVEFIWINRDNRCFEWFVTLLSKIESQQENDSDKFLDICLYMTSALSAYDMKGFALQMALDAMQKKGQTNVVTGLKSSFKPGRPNWKQVFSDINRRKQGNVGIFFCGSPSLSKTIKHYTDIYGFQFSKEHF